MEKLKIDLTDQINRLEIDNNEFKNMINKQTYVEIQLRNQLNIIENDKNNIVQQSQIREQIIEKLQMQRILLAIVALCGFNALLAQGGFPSLNVELRSNLQYNASLSDIWGWADPDTGVEYALVGLQTEDIPYLTSFSQLACAFLTENHPLLQVSLMCNIAH